MFHTVDHLPQTDPRPCLNPGNLCHIYFALRPALLVAETTLCQPGFSQASWALPRPSQATWGLVCLQLGIWRVTAYSAPFWGRQLWPEESRAWALVGGPPWPSAWKTDPSVWQPQLNASVSAFQRRFVVDVRRCEELEKTFGELALGPHPRHTSWRRCQSSLV